MKQIRIRFKSLSKAFKLLFAISFSSILLLQLFLIKLPATRTLFYVVWDIYRELCYAFIATGVYFFFVQHLPLENKKVKYSRFISNRVRSISSEIREVLKNLGLKEQIETGKLPTKEQIKECCSRINPMTKVFDIKSSTTDFNDWYEYLNYKSIVIKRQFSDLMYISELLNQDLVEMLLNIQDVFDNFIFNERSKFANSELSLFAHPLYEVYNYSLIADELMTEQFKVYRPEYNKRYRDTHSQINKRDQVN